MIVMKFGGTSVADGPAVARAARIIASQASRRPIVVSSAMAGVTDRLIQAADRAAHSDLASALTIVDELRDRHRCALHAVVPSGSPMRARGDEALDERLDGLAHTLDALALLEARGPRGTDAVMAHGELLSTIVLTAALEAARADAVWVDAREIMITDASFGRALPDVVELTQRAQARLGPLVDRAAIPVTQGFIGATPQGITTTVGRGGSDLTAALLGAALAVEEVQIWTDVHGLMTADPRVVPAARPLAEASYDEAAELAYFGAKVLHPATMIPVIDANIPLHIRNATDPDAPGTRVSAHPRPQPGGVKSIASKRNVTTIFLQAPRMLGAFGYLRRMFEVFDRHEVAIDVVSTSEVSVSLSIERGAVTDQLVEELERLGRVQVRRDGAIICVVGEALRETPGIAARIFRAIEPVNIQMISQGASKINVTLVVDDGQAAEAVTRLHTEFFG